jgi:hypothetical protein
VLPRFRASLRIALGCCFTQCVGPRGGDARRSRFRYANSRRCAVGAYLRSPIRRVAPGSPRRSHRPHGGAARGVKRGAIMKRFMTRLAVLLATLLPGLGLASVFDAPELRVAPSPTEPRQIHLAAGVRVVDFDVSPVGPTVALLVENPSKAQEIQLWNLDQPQPAKAWDGPRSFTAWRSPQGSSSHPRRESRVNTGPSARMSRPQRMAWRRANTKRSLRKEQGFCHYFLPATVSCTSCEVVPAGKLIGIPTGANALPDWSFTVR